MAIPSLKGVVDRLGAQRLMQSEAASEVTAPTVVPFALGAAIKSVKDMINVCQRFRQALIEAGTKFATFSDMETIREETDNPKLDLAKVDDLIVSISEIDEKFLSIVEESFYAKIDELAISLGLKSSDHARLMRRLALQLRKADKECAAPRAKVLFECIRLLPLIRAHRDWLLVQIARKHESIPQDAEKIDYEAKIEDISKRYKASLAHLAQ